MFIDRATPDQCIFSHNSYRKMTRQEKRYYPDAYIKFQVDHYNICITDDNRTGTTVDYKLLLGSGNS